MSENSWGASINEQIWRELANVGDETLRHGLWTCVILTIAQSVVRRRLGEPPWASSDLIDEETISLIEEWQDDALPSGANLAWVLGDLFYFRDTDLSWDEKFSFAGMACSYASDVVFDLTGQLDGLPAALEAVTEESVEDFYSEWRTRFFRCVLQEARRLAGTPSPGD